MMDDPQWLPNLFEVTGTDRSWSCFAFRVCTRVTASYSRDGISAQLDTWLMFSGLLFLKRLPQPPPLSPYPSLPGVHVGIPLKWQIQRSRERLLLALVPSLLKNGHNLSLCDITQAYT